MSRPTHHLLLFALALAMGSAALAWGERLAPLRHLEGAFSRFILAAALAPPYLIEPGKPPNQTWVARRLAREPLAHTPQFLGLGDDPRRVFEASPPSAGDFAVILSELKRHGHRKVAISVPLAWDEADPIALAALEDQLAAFPLALCASPLARGISPQPIPPAFARASVASTSVTGNPRLLPLVNRTANASVLLARDATLAGFTLLENEDPPDFSRHAAGKALSVPLLARWDQRVVLAFPLLVAMAHAELRPDELEIRLGEFIRLGPQGAVIPIDAFGRFQLPPAIPGAPASGSMPAEALIEALAEDLPSAGIAPRRPPVILRDERTNVTGPEADFAAILADLIVALESSPRPGEAIAFMRPPPWTEAALLLPLAALSSLFLRLKQPSRIAASLVTAALTVVLLLVLGQQLHLTPAGIPALVVLATGLLTRRRRRRRTARATGAYFATTTHLP